MRSAECYLSALSVDQGKAHIGIVLDQCRDTHRQEHQSKGHARDSREDLYRNRVITICARIEAIVQRLRILHSEIAVEDLAGVERSCVKVDTIKLRRNCRQ